MSVRSAPYAVAMRGPAVLRGSSRVVTPAPRSVRAYAGKPTLMYFSIPGRAEVARLCFMMGGIDFEASAALWKGLAADDAAGVMCGSCAVLRARKAAAGRTC